MEHDKVLPYEQEQIDKKTQVTNMFDRIAPYYDFLNRFLSLGIDQRWRKKAIAKIAEAQPKRVLDIATGTADLAIEIQNKVKPTEVIGVDISPKMISIGNEKVLKRKLSNQVKLEVGDSENLRFDEGEFDAVTASFGVRNFGNLEKGLSEMYRILSTGGQLMILEFSKPTIFPFKQLFNSYFKYILPTIGKFTSKDPRAYKYLYESVQAFPDYEDMANILKSVGFKDVEWTPLTLGICTIYIGKK